MASSSRLVAIGYRESGSVEFRITIYGNAGRELPPAQLIASLLEFRSWLGQGQSRARATPSASEAPPCP